ncbi:MAG: CoA-binding protein [Dehalococcoidales bacterium]|nr:MAG: CoA-binding protein [Dehalococcoidales bacterium]
MNHVGLLFDPETVAVVGASNALDKWGAGIFSRVLVSPSVKRAYPVNKTAAEVQGVKAYPSVRDLPEPVDFVAIVIPYPDVPDVVRDCVATGVKVGLIITAGLGETGEEGARLEKEIYETAHQGGMRLVGPNCMGHFNTANGFSTLRMPIPVPKGDVGVISQSGGFAMHILMAGLEAGTGFSKFVSVGNEADLHFEDFFEYLAKDNETKVITGYIEGLRKGREFFKLAGEVTKKKPTVVVKVGRTDVGARAARSHTSAIAGSDEIYDAMFRQAGVIRVNEVEELFDVASALLNQPLPRSNRVGILTGGGGFGCVASDACARLGLDVAPLSPDTIEKLNQVLPDRWPHANPVDTVATGPVTYPCIWPLLEDENLDSLLVIGGIGPMPMRAMSSMAMASLQQADNAPDLIERAERMFQAYQDEEMRNLDKLFEYMDKYQKPVLIFGMNPTMLQESPIYAKLREKGLMIYPTPERAAKTLAHLVQYSRYLNGA